MVFFCYRLERVRSETDSPGGRNSKIMGGGRICQHHKVNTARGGGGGGGRWERKKQMKTQTFNQVRGGRGSGVMQGQHLEIHVEAMLLICIKICYQAVSMATRGAETNFLWVRFILMKLVRMGGPGGGARAASCQSSGIFTDEGQDVLPRCPICSEVDATERWRPVQAECLPPPEGGGGCC